jgi:hypothetical protein
MHRARHLQEEQLFDCYLAIRGGEGIDPPIAEHLTDCPQCGRRYADLTQFMESLSVEADDETDAIFTPERRRVQQQQIARRLEHIGHAARVISFPGRVASPQLGSVAPRFARRWVAASLAAGVFIGVATGIFFDWQASRAFSVRRGNAAARQAVMIGPPEGIEIAADPSDADDAFLSEIELAGQRPRIRELLAVDALTPHAREITLR